MTSGEKYRNFINTIIAGRAWYLYGAGIVAYNIYTALNKEYGLIPKAVVVSTKNEKEHFFSQDRIVEFADMTGQIKKDSLIVIATPEIYHCAIQKLLVKAGLLNYIAVDADFEYEIVARYFSKYESLQLLSEVEEPFLKIRNKVDLCIYMAKCHVDKPIKQVYELPNYIIPIQVGKACTNQIICKQTDDIGQNISIKNKNYSELTAIYWVWKNTCHDYKGICHYRRYLKMPNNIQEYLQYYNIDVIVNLPFICQTDISQQYSRYISKEDFDCLMHAIQDVSALDFEKAKQIYTGKLIYNYNLMIAKKEIFDEYCSWMFSVLEKTEQYCDPDHCRFDRYLGYLGELLTTLYILKNKDKWNLYHVKKVWMV